MFVYWLMFGIPSLAALLVKGYRRQPLVLWYFVGMMLVFLIGFRHDVGGDWSNYILHYDAMAYKTLSEALSHGDPGHQLLNWLSFQWGLGVYGVNVVYAVFFVWGLMRFAKRQSYPWLTMVVAVPYLITVVVMGYSRQGVAIGLFLLAVTYLDEKKFLRYVLLIFIASLFHKTAMLLLPLGVFLYGKGKWIRILMIIPIVYGTWDLLLAKDQEHLWHNYVELQMQSQGAIIRVLMNLVPSMLLLLYHKEWKKTFSDYAFWFWIAMGSIAAVALVGISSTAVDRMSLYFIPIQLVVFSRLPYLAHKHFSPSAIKLGIVIGYAIVYFVWLNYAAFAPAWIPYQNILFKGLV